MNFFDHAGLVPCAQGVGSGGQSRQGRRIAQLPHALVGGVDKPSNRSPGAAFYSTSSPSCGAAERCAANQTATACSGDFPRNRAASRTTSHGGAISASGGGFCPLARQRHRRSSHTRQLRDRPVLVGTRGRGRPTSRAPVLGSAIPFAPSFCAVLCHPPQRHRTKPTGAIRRPFCAPSGWAARDRARPVSLVPSVARRG